MKRTLALTALTLTSALALSACSDGGESERVDSTTGAQSTAVSESPVESHAHGDSGDEHGDAHGDSDAHDHPEDGGQPPAGIHEANNPTYPVGTKVVLEADHMPGMDGAPATISGAFTTTTYAVSYTPTDGGKPITDHRWVVHEELVDPGQAPLPDGTEVVLDAEHMSGMKGAKATIDYSTEQTVYMVDVVTDDMKMTNHKWVTESEIKPAS